MAALALSEILPIQRLNTILPWSRFPREFHSQSYPFCSGVIYSSPEMKELVATLTY